MVVTDENESPVEVLITKNRHCKFTGFAGVLHREPSWWFTELQGARSRTIADVLLPDNTNVTDNIQAGDPLRPRLWDNHGVVAMVLHAT